MLLCIIQLVNSRSGESCSAHVSSYDFICISNVRLKMITRTISAHSGSAAAPVDMWLKHPVLIIWSPLSSRTPLCKQQGREAISVLEKVNHESRLSLTDTSQSGILEGQDGARFQRLVRLGDRVRNLQDYRRNKFTSEYVATSVGESSSSHLFIHSRAVS